jgi:hypothetical protein
MTIEIDQPELEELIRQRMASGEFESFSDLIRRALIALATAAPEAISPNGPTPDQRADAFRRWAESHKHETILPEEAMTRAGFYGDRG